jgi:XTP/dITP diphosphohydrolase
MSEKLKAFGRLLDIMDELRDKCPWDKKQSIQSLRQLTIEETYELADAILENNMQEIKKELGDIILHIVFYSKIASEQNQFDITDVLNGICEKLIYRHPHIFGDTKVESDEDVKRNWEALKLKEGKKSIMSGVPASLPAMVKAMRIQEKAKAVGFDWKEKEPVWEKIKEEINELHVEVEKKSDHKRVEEEMGDVLFTLVNYSRFIGVDAEMALEKTNKKFMKRFAFIEQSAQKDNKQLTEMTLEEMDKYWNESTWQDNQ